MAASMKIGAFWYIVPCSISRVDQRFRGVYCLMMKALRIPETSVYSSKTKQRYIPESSNLHNYMMFAFLVIIWHHSSIQHFTIRCVYCCLLPDTE
jgi:hypothetical protein